MKRTGVAGPRSCHRAQQINTQNDDQFGGGGSELSRRMLGFAVHKHFGQRLRCGKPQRLQCLCCRIALCFTDTLAARFEIGDGRPRQGHLQPSRFYLWQRREGTSKIGGNRPSELVTAFIWLHFVFFSTAHLLRTRPEQGSEEKGNNVKNR